MKLCMVTTFYPPYSFGGDGVFVQQLARDLVQAGHEVHVIHCTDAWRTVSGRSELDVNHQGESDDGVIVHSLESRIGRLSALITQQTGRPGPKRRHISDVLAQGFDVVNFHNISLVGGPGVLGMGKAPRIFTLHEHWWVCPTHILHKYTGELCEEAACLRCTLAHGTPPQAWRASKKWMAHCLKNVDLILSPSEFTAERHRRWMQAAEVDVALKILPEYTVPLEPPGALEVDLPDRFFLYVGRLSRAKGVDSMLAAFAQRPDYPLVVVGESDDGRPLPPDQSNVRFVGRVERKQLGDYYEKAQALVFPSLCAETFGLTAVESLSCGTPVIARASGGVADTINPEVGVLYEQESGLLDALDQFWLNPSLSEGLRSACLARYASRYTRETYLESYLSIIRQLPHN